MKKIALATGILISSLMGFAQTTNLQPATDTQAKPHIAVAPAPEKRIARLESELASLKASQVEMKKQLSDIQSVLPANNRKKKLEINRVGSKQVNWIKKEEQ